MKAGMLREAIANIPDDADVMVIHEGVLRHTVAISSAPNGSVAIIRCQGKSSHSKHFSVAEDGLLGGLTAMGMVDETIAELLERSVDSVKRRKKAIGLK